MIKEQRGTIVMKAILVGGFNEMIELCELCNIKIVGIIDNDIHKEYPQYSILGTDNDAARLYSKYHSVPVVITPDSPNIRKKLVDYYSSIGYSFLSVISPKAEISKSSLLGKGVVIQSGVNISSNANVGDFVKLNTNSNIMHDCKIEGFTTVAPNAVLLGRVKVGSSCYIGANSTILPDVIIHKKAVVGAGSVVVKNVEKGKTVKSVPAK